MEGKSNCHKVSETQYIFALKFYGQYKIHEFSLWMQQAWGFKFSARFPPPSSLGTGAKFLPLRRGKGEEVSEPLPFPPPVRGYTIQPQCWGLQADSPGLGELLEDNWAGIQDDGTHTHNWLPPGEALHQAYRACSAHRSAFLHSSVDTSVSVQLGHHPVSRTPAQSSPKCPLPPVQPRVPGTAQSTEFTLNTELSPALSHPQCALSLQGPLLWLQAALPQPGTTAPPARGAWQSEQRGVYGQCCYTPGFRGGGWLGDEALTQTLPFIFKAGYKTQPKEQWGNMQGPRRKDGVSGAGCEHSVASFPTFSGAGCGWAEKEALLSPETRRDSAVMFHQVRPEPMSGVSPVPSVPSPASLRGSQTGGKWSSWDFWVRFRKEASAQNSETQSKQCLGTSPSGAGVIPICFSS